MNIIGIDPSLISTAIVVNGKTFNYCRESAVVGKKGMLKWYKISEEFITYRYINHRKFSTYSEGELIKLKDYDNITDMIITDILNNIDKSSNTKIGIEGYSYSSTSGSSIIDLVTFSTLLRKKLYDYVSKDIIIFSPSTLKQEACKLTYKPIEVGKKVSKLEYRNNQGISGGAFTKIEMALALIENEKLNSDWVVHLRSIKDELLNGKKIQKPAEDVNDAHLIYEIIKIY